MKTEILSKAKKLAFRLGTLFANTLTTTAVDYHQSQK